MVASQPILVGLIGAGIQSSLSPAMHQREGAAQGFGYTYRLIDLDLLGLTAAALPDLMASAEREGFAGLNITFPCKQAVIERLDELSPDARAIGAVNTVLFGNGRRIGHNTDCSGFAESFRRAMANARRDRVVLFGAGGAGAAVAHALLTLDTRQLVLLDVDAGRPRSCRSIARAEPGGRWRLKIRRRQLRVPMAWSMRRRSAWRDFRVCRCRPSCFHRIYGSPTSSIFRWRRNCSGRRRRAAAKRCPAPAWPCSRRPAPSVCSVVPSRTPAACSRILPS
jgi:Shikimate dehydrogenase substrate binding domain